MQQSAKGTPQAARRLLTATLLATLVIGGCKFLKKGESGPDAQASAVASAAPNAVPVVVPEVAQAVSAVAQVASIASAVPSAPQPTTHVSVPAHASTVASNTAAPTASSATPAATAAASAQPSATAAASAPTVGVLNPQCQVACQKSYQDCVSQSSAASGLDVIRKCKNALIPCITACK
jgi:hypothetical protein